MKTKLFSRIAVCAVAAVIALGVGSAFGKTLNAAGNGFETEPNDSVPQANSIVAGTVYYGERTENDKDYYKLTIPSSGRIKITMNADYALYFSLLDSSEETLDNEYASYSQFGERRMTYDLTKGTYYFRISGYFNDSKGNYNFYYNFESANESFPETGYGSNNLISKANTVALNKVYKALFSMTDRRDYFKFALTQPGEVNLTINAVPDMKYVLLDSKENVLFKIGDYSSITGEYKRSFVLSSGTYYWEMIPYSNQTGSYNFTMTFDGVRFSNAPKTMVSGSSQELNLVNAGDMAVTWKSSNPSILQVSSSGTLLASKAGNASIMATVGGKTIKTSVQVLYKDVTDPSKFWYEPTNVLTNRGIVQGYDKQTTFKPTNNCTRAQMVTFLWRLKGTPNPKASSTKFKDVKKTAYYYKAVLWATEKGITTGYSKTKFKPNNVCTRAQTVTFLWRMAGKPNPKSKTNKFKDIASKDYFYKAVLWASEKKIVEGYKNKTFRPQNKCTRRQMVTFLYKYSKNVK